MWSQPSQLFTLFRSYRSRTARLGHVEASELAHTISGLPPLFYSDKGLEAFEAHSGRSAWVFAPWEDIYGKYPGFEYKGCGNIDGKAVKIVNTLPQPTIFGAQRLDWAQDEYQTSIKVWDIGIPCQRPLALFRIQLQQIPIEAGLMVRTCQSPIRLVDFWYRPWIYKEYLGLTGETRTQHAARIGNKLGTSLRRLIEHNMSKPLDLDNVSSEGELIDFEHVWNAWFSPLPMSVCYPYESLFGVFREFPLLFREDMPVFEEAFTNAFCDTVPIKPGAENIAYQCLTRFYGCSFKAEELLAPVDPGMRSQLLKNCSQTLKLYEQLKTHLPPDFNSSTQEEAEGNYLLQDLDQLLQMTKEKLDRLAARTNAHTKPAI